MQCPQCQAENDVDLRFCESCGAKLARLCAICGHELKPQARFCGKCGAASAADASTATAQKQPPQPIRVASEQTEVPIDGERKTITALFADIKGSMELIEDLDPEEARAIVDPALHLMIEAVRRYDGYVAQSTGDGIFALFGAPVAHEDHPQRALYAALRMQESLRRYSDKLREQGHAPVAIRVGVNTGEVVVRTIQTGKAQAEYTPIGHSTSLAARLQALAAPGSIAVNDTVRKLVEGYFSLKSLGPARIKGVREPVQVYEVTGLGPLRTRLQRSAGRGLTKFIGRENEMAALAHAAELAKTGHGQLVAAVAEAGVGKSRLFHEFKARTQSGWMVLEAFSVSHGKATAYLPVIDVLHSYFRIANEDDTRTRREKVAGRLSILDPTLEDARPYLFALLALAEGEDPLAQLEAQTRRRRTHEAIQRVLLRESLDQPLMLIFEDLHWIDDETQALLNLLADSIGTAKVLLLTNYRPEYTHSWGSKAYYTQLRLDPLGKESAGEMLAALIGESQDLTRLKPLIINRTDGNPFFMEEIVQDLFEEGALVRDGEIKLTRPLDGLHIPATVQAILAARIDRLPAEEKELLQTVAAAGREFALGLVRAVSGNAEDELDRMLNHLQLAEFIYEQPAVGDTEYIFKHALTQEVAYQSVLVERRKALHERIAQAIEARFANQIDDHVVDLALHYGRSGNLRKAAAFSLRAGQQAAQRSAYAEAVAHLTTGLELLKSLPDDAECNRIEIAVQLALAETVRVSESYRSEKIEPALNRAQELCEKTGNDLQLFEVLFALSRRHTNRLEMARARRVLEQLVVVADRTQDPVLSGRANFVLAVALMFEGQLGAAHEHGSRALAQLASHEASLSPAARDLRTLFLMQSALTSLLIGYPDKARENARGAPARGEWASPSHQRDVLNYLCQFHLCLREAMAAREAAENGISIAAEHAPASLAFMIFHRGWALVLLDRTEQGLADMLNLQQSLGATGYLPTRTYLGPAEGYLRAGQCEQALAQVNEGLEVAAKTGVRMYEAELQRVRGEALLRRDPPDLAQAEACFRKGIEIARGQSAKWWELRATVSVARLLARTGRRDEARTLLTEIYGWFTEGFDTRDLQDAKALLDAL